jgi:putative transposase
MQMNRKELEAFAKKAAKGIKTPQDLNDYSRMLKKITVEAALNAEMEEHLDYEKHAKSVVKNSRNGMTTERIKTEDGEFDLDTPRDRDGSFEPKLVKKNQSRFTSMDEKILWLYAQGMSTREIVQAFDEWYGADISPTLISRVTNAVIDKVVEWQSRPLDPIYPIIYLDCLVVKIRQDKRVINKSIFLALGINTEGQKELMGM